MASIALNVVPEVYSEFVRTEYKLLAEIRIASPDINTEQLALRLGVTPATIRTWLRRADYQRYESWLIERRRPPTEVLTPTSRFKSTNIQGRFEEYQAEMQDRLLDIIETTKDQRLEANLVQEWLGYSGIITAKKAQAENTGMAPITVDKLIMFVARASEAGLQLPVIEAARLNSITPTKGDDEP